MATKKKTVKKKIQKSIKKKQTLEDIEKKLWLMADKFRVNMDVTEYKHVVLGLIFLKYLSDDFDKFRKNLRKQFKDPKHENFYKNATKNGIEQELENKDYYKSQNIFWVPVEARWFGNTVTGDQGLQDDAEQAYIGKRIDNAMAVLEKENSKLKKVLPKDFARQQSNVRLGELVNLISTIGFNDTERPSRDIFTHVYEYFLSQFAFQEGKKGGQFYTPKSVVNLVVECLEPYKGRIYDPAMGSGGFFVSRNRFIKMYSDQKHFQKTKQNISFYGQESNPTTWRLVAMNMAIRGIDFNFGKEPADTFHKNQHPDLKADFIMTSPPFNISNWGRDKLIKDRRWKYGIPPKNNANFAWIQHVIDHLSPRGYVGIVLANGSMSSDINNEGMIRKKLLESDLVDCMIAFPGQLFLNTQIPACIWILAKDKSGKDGKRKRKNEVLFIDARNTGEMINRTQRAFSDNEIQKIAGIYHSWRNKGKKYADIKGFCKSSVLEEIKSNNYVLTPGKYVEIDITEGDVLSFHKKMNQLTKRLKDEFAKSEKLEKEIKKNLSSIGFEV